MNKKRIWCIRKWNSWRSIISKKNVGHYNVFILNDKDFQNELNLAKEKNLVLYNGIKLDKWKKNPIIPLWK